MPRERCRSRSSSSTCACTVTSSAVVGSSAISSAGSQASAIAIITRCFMPPDNWNGYSLTRRTASGIRTASSSSMTRASTAAPLRAVCRRTDSAICAPMVITGFSDSPGSWKIIATRRPRTSRICDSGSASRFCPSSSTTPPVIVAASGSRRISDSAVIDFPQPDSPTSAKVSPAAMSNDTPSTARTGGPSPWICVRRSRTLSSGFMLMPQLPHAPAADRRHHAPHRQTGWRPEPAPA